MFCENCGTRLPDNSVICAQCGARTEPDAPVPGGASAQGTPPSPMAPVPVQGQQHISAPPPVTPPYASQQSGPAYQPPPPKKSRTGLVVVIVLVIVVLGVGGFFGYKALTGQDKPIIGAVVSSSASGSAGSSHSAANSSSATSSGSPTSSGSATSSGNPASSAASAAASASASTPQAQDFKDYKGYAKGEIPSIGDFFWFTEDVKWDGLPSGRTVITDFDAISGYWKAYEESIPMFEGDERYLMWLNAEISGTANQATLTYHSDNAIAYSDFIGGSIDLTGWYGSNYKGSFSGGKLVVGNLTTDGIEVVIKEFYTIDGKQYAVGEEHWSVGEACYFVLVRP